MIEPLSLHTIASLVSGDLIGDASLTISGYDKDSRSLTTGSLFVAISGTSHDGHAYLEEVVAHGYPVLVQDPSLLPKGANAIVVQDSRKAWSTLQAHRFAYPSRDLLVVGVTGTNGKSTIQWMVTQGLTAVGHAVLRVGTLGAAFGNILNEDTLTTPDAADLQQYLSVARDNGGTAAALEVSSHALSQERVSDIEFDIGIFSNLTQDHGDYHESLEEYFEAKAKLFSLTQKAAIICIDNRWGELLVERLKESSLHVITYGLSPFADVRVKEFSQTMTGSTFTIEYKSEALGLHSSSIGSFNAQNLAGTVATLLASGSSFRESAKALEEIPGVPGRLEGVGGNGKGIFVDYSHTPDSLEHALQALKALPHQSLWVIFGCGGDRDKTKRPEMGRVAALLADKVIVTSDNPRTEDPQAIVEDILAAGFSPELVELDRVKAIEYAVSKMQSGDLLLVAGKGHEDYQIIGTTKIHMSDQEIVKNALKSHLK